MMKPSEAVIQILILVLIILLIVLFMANFGYADPVGVDVDSNSTDTGPSRPPANHSAEGGTITTLLLNVSQQSTYWKGYVGNISGQLALQDSSNYTLYDWTLSSITGEVFASRSSAINWSDIGCTNVSMMESEDSALGIPATEVETINKTFNGTTHKTFTVAGVTITNSTCPSIFTNVNSTSQSSSESALFQEILLDDEDDLVFVTIMEQDETGYNNQTYDFQFIIPDTYSSATQTTYYFWAEIS